MSRRRPLGAPLPVILQRRHTDEFLPAAYSVDEARAVRRVLGAIPRAAARTGLGEHAYAAGRRGTAAGLLALNEAYGERFYDVPGEAALDDEAAREAFRGEEVVIDVQTHFLADRPALNSLADFLLDLYRGVAPDWWKGLDGVTAYTLADYLRCVFLESETAVAVLTSGPGRDDGRMLHDSELAATHELLDRLGPSGRLLHHAVVHPNFRDEIESMEDRLARFRPAGWKVYTIGKRLRDGSWVEDWALDDESTGIPFLERCRALGTDLVCVHKGISKLAPAGSPRDVGPVTRAFPDLRFVVYHSGYEMPEPGVPVEGAYDEASRDTGVNRLVASLEDCGVSPGANVFAELGTTWFCLVRRPREAAHVLGKLLLAVGDDNLVWGTDSIWYGPSQPVIDAFRAFRIPESMQSEFGYPALTPERKAKILSRNGARLYGIDLDRARRLRDDDDLAWMKAVLEEAGPLGLGGP